MTDRQAPLNEVDPKIADLIRKEVARQEYGLELIASENFVSVAVLEAMGTALTNKYAEGLPNKRYYGGLGGGGEGEQHPIYPGQGLGHEGDAETPTPPPGTACATAAL